MKCQEEVKYIYTEKLGIIRSDSGVTQWVLKEALTLLIRALSEKVGMARVKPESDRSLFMGIFVLSIPIPGAISPRICL